jgi:hypothetical protein
MRGSRRTRAVLLLSAPVFALAVVGCAPSSASPTSGVPTSSLPATLAHGSNGEVRPIQAQVGAPRSRIAAVDEATKTIGADQLAFFEIFEGKIPGDSLRGFESGSYLKFTNDYINAIGDDENAGGVTGQADLWRPDPTKTHVTSLIDRGRTYQFGVVTMLGCFKSRSALAWISNTPSPTPQFGDLFPYEVTVQYSPTKHVWLITEEASLNNVVGLPTCSVPSS